MADYGFGPDLSFLNKKVKLDLLADIPHLFCFDE